MNTIIIIKYFDNTAKKIILEIINIINYARKKFSRRKSANKKSHAE